MIVLSPNPAERKRLALHTYPAPRCRRAHARSIPGGDVSTMAKKWAQPVPQARTRRASQGARSCMPLNNRASARWSSRIVMTTLRAGGCALKRIGQDVESRLHVKQVFAGCLRIRGVGSASRPGSPLLAGCPCRYARSPSSHYRKQSTLSGWRAGRRDGQIREFRGQACPSRATVPS